MRKRVILLISIGVFGALCWTATTFVCGLVTGVRGFGLLKEWAEQTVMVERENLESEPGVTVLDANNAVFKVVTEQPNRVEVQWSGGATHMKGPKCRVKQLGSPLTRVMGRVNGREYPVVVDSGLSYNMIVNDVAVIESGLAIYPLDGDTTTAGLCHVPKLEIGEISITDPPCFYELRHYEKRVLGRTKWVDRDIIVGLRLMKNFKYILIDNVLGEVEFCGEGGFEPEPNDVWPHYSMSIEQQKRNLERLMVMMPVAGEKRKIMLDTGADCGILVSACRWPDLSAGLKVLKRSRDRVRMRDGWKEVSVVTVASMQLGERSIDRAAIHVMEDEGSAEEYFLLGMGYFHNTVIVLDFANCLLWVKSAE